MIIGNPSVFAIESSITQAFDRPSFLAIGYFVIIVGDRHYGVRRLDATMLACSFDQVARRLRERGSHTAYFAAKCPASEIADDFRIACYTGGQNLSCSGISIADYFNLIHSSRIVWAPDGDQAFDDGSYVLQFDIEERVRLIAFKIGPNGLHDPDTLSDKWLNADEYYKTLQQWHTAFKSEWVSLPKKPD